jgi:hypothetical protein
VEGAVEHRVRRLLAGIALGEAELIGEIVDAHVHVQMVSHIVGPTQRHHAAALQPEAVAGIGQRNPEALKRA